MARQKCTSRCCARNLFILLTFAIFGFIAFVPVHHVVAQRDDSGRTIDLTDAERAWLAEHDVIRIGVDPDYAPYSFVDDNGNYVGIAMDFVELLSDLLDAEMEVVPGLSWPEIVDGARGRSVDVVITAVQTEERDEFLDFTEIYLPTPLVIMTRTEDGRIESASDLAGKTVALVDGYSSSQRVQNEHPDIEPYLVATPLEGLFAVSAGNADAYVGVIGTNLYLASTYGIQNLKIASEYDLQGNGQRLGVRNDWPELAPILDKALLAIPEDEKSRIFQRWLPIQYAVETAAGANSSLMLTTEEAAWLQAHPVIRVAADPNHAPIEYRAPDGTFAGVSIDYLQRISQLLGVEFVYHDANTWEEVIARVENRELDMFSAAVPTEEREQFSIFTNPYLILPAVIFTNEDVSFIGDLSELEGQKVAAIRGVAVTESLKQDYPEIELIETDNITTALAKVAQKEAVAYIGSILTTGNYIREGGYQNIKVSGESPYQVEISMAARSDWPILASVLQKSLNVISAEEQDLIARRWSTIEVEQAFDYRQLLWIGLIAVFVFGVVAGWNISLRREISKRKQTEEALRQAIETAEIVQLEAERANQAKSTFLANMSHELRTPLNAIIGFARLMKRDASLPPKVQKNLNIINVSGEHLLSLINDVLDMSRIEAGRMTLNNTVFNLHDLLRDLEGMLRNRVQSKGVQFVVNLNPSLPTWVETDEKKLRQVLINLLGNAIKFTEAGSIALTVTAVFLEAQNENGRRTAKLVFSIADTGIGIAADEMNKVFAPFVQTRSGQLSGEGTGLGLPISRQFVQLMGGDIRLKSEVNKGSTFAFDIFVHIFEPDEIEAPAKEVRVIGLAPEQPDYRILIVDDVQENRALMQTLLTDVGFTVREADNGQAALAIWESWQPHLIWMDMRMPIMDGMMATQLLRNAEAEHPDQKTVIIALSSSVLEEEQEAILAIGADAFVAKPYREAEVFRIMADYLGVEFLYEESDVLAE